MASNYPPGVSGNEPQITGEWPIEQVVDGADVDLKKATDLVEDVAGLLDDQGMPNALMDQFNEVSDAISKLRDSVQALVTDAEDAEIERAEARLDDPDLYR